MDFNLSRRIFLGSSLVLIAGQTLANQAGAIAPRSPFESVGPFREDASRVIEFFSFTCPFCRQYAEQFSSWGKSIPFPVIFEQIPAVADNESVGAAMAFYSAKAIAAKDLDKFIAALFAALQDQGRSAQDPKTYIAAMSAAGIPPKSLSSKAVETYAKKSVERAIKMTARYNISTVPSIGVAGAFVLNPDLVGGDYKNLFALANGLISQTIIAKGKS
jgi:thiol:disulfide interchange protein DsbA